MSIRVMSQVWTHSKMKGSALLLLLAISDYAHDDGGGAYPSVESLAAKIRMSERQTRNLIRLLETNREIETDSNGGPHGTNAYTVLIGGAKIAALPPRGGQSSVVRGATVSAGKGGNPLPPNRPVTIKNRAFFKTTEEYDAYWQTLAQRGGGPA